VQNLCRYCVPVFGARIPAIPPSPCAVEPEVCVGRDRPARVQPTPYFGVINIGGRCIRPDETLADNGGVIREEENLTGSLGLDVPWTILWPSFANVLTGSRKSWKAAGTAPGQQHWACSTSDAA